MTASRTLSRALAILFSLALIAGLAPPGPARAAGPQRAHPRLLEEARQHPDEVVRVIVTRQNGDRSADRHVAGKGRRKIKEVASVGFVAELSGRDIAELATHPGVRYLAPDAPMRRANIDGSALAPVPGQVAYQQAVGAPAQWAAGLTGRGVGVAVVDTGINGALPDFADGHGGGSRVVATKRFSSAPATAAAPTAPLGATGTAVAPVPDGVGHGTHVAGVIGGNSWSSPDSAVRGKYVGVAPEVNLIDLRVSDDAGQSYLSDVVDAVEWAVANRQAYNIRVLNLSLQSTVAESAATNVLAAAVERAWFNGIFVVVAAGNQGPETEQYAPANDPFVVAVGASDTAGTVAQADDTLAWWSSYGSTQDGYGRPDLVAPGRWIPSTLASPTSVLAAQHPERVLDGGHIWMSGTSMAAPVVAGTAALLFQAHPEYTNDAAKWLLMRTATPLPGVAGSGAGEINATAALGYAGALGLANGGLPISQQLVGPNGATTYTSSSWSTSSWSTSSWSSSSWSSSSWSSSSWSSSSWSSGASTAAPWAAIDYP
jgi:serine protease AprX